MSAPKTTFLAACFILACHAAVLATLRTSDWGALLSDIAQESMGLLVLYAVLQAARRSESFGRYFWRITAFAFSIWLIGQTLTVYVDIDGFFRHAEGPNPLDLPLKILFALWFLPLGVAVFLNPEQELKELDWLLLIDFLQAGGLVLVAYLFFFYIPSLSGSGNRVLSDAVMDRYFLVHAALIGAFLLRYVNDKSSTRVLFGNIAGFLFVSALIDFMYYHGPAERFVTGSPFDILWSGVLLIPLTAATRWKEAQRPGLPAGRVQAPAMIVTQLFPLLYPLLILVLSSRIAQRLIAPAALVVLLSYACSIARMVITHHRLLVTEKALRHQAAHDGLTGVLNRTAILDILEKELLRAGRNGSHVGVMIVDADHFKDINDRYGHRTGDAVLCQLTSAMTSSVRPYDFVGRLGGEEFLVVTPECSIVETRDLAERIRRQIESCEMPAAESTITFTASVGVTSGGIGCDLASVLSAADSALYMAKRNGRNRVESVPIPSAERAHLDLAANT